MKLPLPTAPNEVWSLDFISDATTEGRAIRGFIAKDDFFPMLLKLHVSYSIGAHKVVELLDHIAAFRSYPKYVRVDVPPVRYEEMCWNQMFSEEPTLIQVGTKTGADQI